eukprot:TRINITY_DN67287_c6_g2_i1.p1 TRINITY_DN67287_c6_g2~~TRINITY_DN67287_c6_g2_i1.p1  ORF type:complete len:857 (-),score=74.44 TRINITY_DN67287_c6_g2_i1:113-2683(-)
MQCGQWECVNKAVDANFLEISGLDTTKHTYGFRVAAFFEGGQQQSPWSSTLLTLFGPPPVSFPGSTTVGMPVNSWNEGVDFGLNAENHSRQLQKFHPLVVPKPTVNYFGSLLPVHRCSWTTLLLIVLGGGARARSETLKLKAMKLEAAVPCLMKQTGEWNYLIGFGFTNAEIPHLLQSIGSLSKSVKEQIEGEAANGSCLLNWLQDPDGYCDDDEDEEEEDDDEQTTTRMQSDQTTTHGLPLHLWTALEKDPHWCQIREACRAKQAFQGADNNTFNKLMMNLLGVSITRCVLYHTALQSFVPGIHNPTDKILGTDKQIFSVLGFNNDTHSKSYGNVQIVINRDVLHHPDTNVTITAATSINTGRTYHARPWRLQSYTRTPEEALQIALACPNIQTCNCKEKAPATVQQELNGSKLHCGWPQTYSLIAYDGHCQTGFNYVRKVPDRLGTIHDTLNKTDLPNIQAHFEGLDPHGCMEAHLPSFVPLHQIHSIIVPKHMIPRISGAAALFHQIPVFYPTINALHHARSSSFITSTSSSSGSPTQGSPTSPTTSFSVASSFGHSPSSACFGSELSAQQHYWGARTAWDVLRITNTEQECKTELRKVYNTELNRIANGEYTTRRGGIQPSLHIKRMFITGSMQGNDESTLLTPVATLLSLRCGFSFVLDAAFPNDQKVILPYKFPIPGEGYVWCYAEGQPYYLVLTNEVDPSCDVILEVNGSTVGFVKDEMKKKVELPHEYFWISIHEGEVLLGSAMVADLESEVRPILLRAMFTSTAQQPITAVGFQRVKGADAGQAGTTAFHQVILLQNPMIALHGSPGVTGSSPVDDVEGADLEEFYEMEDDDYDYDDEDPSEDVDQD